MMAKEKTVGEIGMMAALLTGNLEADTATGAEHLLIHGQGTLARPGGNAINLTITFVEIATSATATVTEADLLRGAEVNSAKDMRRLGGTTLGVVATRHLEGDRMRPARNPRGCLKAEETR